MLPLLPQKTKSPLQISREGVFFTGNSGNR
jgi:hypothetical protein